MGYTVRALLHTCQAHSQPRLWLRWDDPRDPTRLVNDLEIEMPSNAAIRWCQRLPNAVRHFEESKTLAPTPRLLGGALTCHRPPVRRRSMTTNIAYDTIDTVTRAQEVEPVLMANIARRLAHVWYGLILS